MEKLTRMIKMITANALAGCGHVIFLPPDY